MKKNLVLGTLIVLLAMTAMPIQAVQASYATFNNPAYDYTNITSASSGTYYRQAGFSPDGTKVVAVKQVGASWEIVLMNADGSGEAIISPGDSGTGDIAQYTNPFWSDDGMAIGFLEVHNANSNKVVRYDISGGTRTYIYEPVGTDVANPDFLGSSKTAIVFWAYGPVGGADLFTWDGATLTNITNTADYKEYEPVSNADGTKIVYWSGETTAEPVNTTHTLTYSGGTWTKDVGFTPITDSYWAYWTTPAATQIALTVMSSKDIHLYDSTGVFVTDLSGPGYSGGSGQWNFFGPMPQSPNGKFAITSNAGRGGVLGRDIIIATPLVNHGTDISGKVDNTVSITVTAPDAFSFSTFGPGDNTACSKKDGSVVVTAGSNGVADWRVDVASATSPAFDGYMWRWDGSSYLNPLATKLIIGPNSGDVSYWADTGYSVTGTITDSGKALGLCGKQTITAADKTSGTYWITIVFTGSVTP
jgi:hypothetical protein